MNPVLALRYRKGLNLSQVADEVDVARQTLSAVERGRVPSAPVAAKLATFYDVRVEQILGHEPLPDEAAA